MFKLTPEQLKKRTQDELKYKDDPKYSEYFKLNEYQKMTLDCDNYWRIISHQPYIEVPPSDFHYYRFFDKRCFEIAKKRKKLDNYFLYKINSDLEKTKKIEVIKNNKLNGKKR